MKIWFAAIAMVSLVGLASAQDDDKTPFDKLKEAVAKKDPDQVKVLAAETLKFAQQLMALPKPADAGELKEWQSRVESGKEVSAYSEYALAFTAEQGLEPAKTIELVDALIAQNPKSKYLDDVCANAYLVALGKTGGGAAKQLDGMAKIATGRTDNTVALTVLTEGYSQKAPDRALRYANQLIVAARKPKPDGFSESDWDKTRNSALATGYYWAGVISGQKQIWIDCNKNLQAALPLISGDTSKLGMAYFSLGICNFNFGKITNDRTKMQAGQQFMEKASATKGPYQSQAYQQNGAMKQALATGR